MPVWHSRLTTREGKQIERVKKTTFHNIMGDKYNTYENSLKVLLSEKLSDRRQMLCLNFANKAAKHTKHQNWFSPPTTNQDIRQSARLGQNIERNVVKPVPARTVKYEKSTIPYLTRLLNGVDELV